MEQVPPPPQAEDAAGDGEAIETFSSYHPSALPPCLIDSLRSTEESFASRENGRLVSTNTAKFVKAKTNLPSSANTFKETDLPHHEVIEITDTSCSSFEDAVSQSLVLDTAKLPVTETGKADAFHGGVGNKNRESKAANDDGLPSSSASTQVISSHTSPVCESSLLSSVSAPQTSDESAMFLVSLARKKALSPLQLEGSTLAITRHNRLLVSTSASPKSKHKTVRAGFFIGDGAGVGKGRQIAAILLDSMCRGRTRHLWISVSRELYQDAVRDLRDVGCHCDVHDGSDLLDQTGGVKGRGSAAKGLGAGGGLGKGVLFVTYPLLVSGQGRRLEEIILWLSSSRDGMSTLKSGAERGDKQLLQSNQTQQERAFSGVIVFDEAHKAKNLDADSQTARLVIELQCRLPHARIVYVSATGVSDIKHMVYATRLGLWGAGNPLYPKFENFQRILTNRGVGSLEMLALEMKRMGSFVARTLSWEGAEFDTMEIPLEHEQIVSYDNAAKWWKDLKEEIEDVLAYLKISAPKTLWRAYWAHLQRFFRELAVCAKVPRVAREAKKYLAEGCSVVIGLQSTGEAGTQSALENLGDKMVQASAEASLRRNLSDAVLPSLLCTAASKMTSFVRNHFPVSVPPPDVPKVPPIPPNGFSDERERSEYLRLEAEAERIKSLPPPAPIAVLVERRRIALEAVEGLGLPPNPLDHLIDLLGGVDQVAEMTGRSGRIVRTKDNKQFRYVNRTQNSKSFGLSLPCSDEADRVNLVEKKKFMEGSKRVAIISDAASTGISLHAAEGSGAGNRRRVHFTIELPWAADKALQQLGRSHRSGQTSAPIYKMVVTTLGGERRFAAAVAKRMANLGALTKGDRRAATGSDLSAFDVDSLYGRRAVKRVLACLKERSAPSRKSDAVLDEYVRCTTDDEFIEKVRRQDIRTQRSYALLMAQKALRDVGLISDGGSESPKNAADVKVFLNRIAALEVRRQNMLFGLFLSTFDDVVADAKATGEYEGSVADVKATFIELEGRPEKLCVDQSTGAPTVLQTIVLDRGTSFQSVVEMSLKGMRENEEHHHEEKTSQVAKSGFYVSKRKIAGRLLVLFAKRKIEPSSTSDVYDPRGLMVVTRPNTGTNPCEMPTNDLHIKYQLLLSSYDMRKAFAHEKLFDTSEGLEEQREKAVDIIRRNFRKPAKLWDDAYIESNKFAHSAGLAPRKSRMGLITGAVLHVLPALEKAVIMRGQSDRALRVIRVELSESGQRLVGVRFPLDNDALVKLKAILTDLNEARKASARSNSFRDENFDPADERSVSWATTERKTMKTFFAPSSKTNTDAPLSSSRGLPPSGLKRKEPTEGVALSSPLQPNSSNRKKSKLELPSKFRQVQKTNSIKNFFISKKK